MDSAIDTLIPLWESRQCTLTCDDWERWSPAARETLRETGVLTPTRSATHVVCDACHDDHVERVERVVGPRGQVTFRLRCPEAGWVLVDPMRLEQWTLDLHRVVDLVAVAVAARGGIRCVVADRLWSLGRITWQTSLREVFVARGLDQPDAQLVVGRINGAQRPLVLVLPPATNSTVWRDRPVAVVALSQTATLAATGFQIDAAAFAATVAAAEVPPPVVPALGVDPEQLKLVVRRQVKAERQTELTDAIYAAAYRQCGNLRGAAEFLSQQTGRMVSKDAVARAIRRAGGITEVLRHADSESVVRGRSSHRRDTPLKSKDSPNW